MGGGRASRRGDKAASGRAPEERNLLIARGRWLHVKGEGGKGGGSTAQ